MYRLVETLLTPFVPSGGFSATLKVIVLVPTYPTMRAFIQTFECFTTKKDTMVGACRDLFNTHCQWIYDLLSMGCVGGN
jgi:hypothetical protein